MHLGPVFKNVSISHFWWRVQCETQEILIFLLHVSKPTDLNNGLKNCFTHQFWMHKFCHTHIFALQSKEARGNSVLSCQIPDCTVIEFTFEIKLILFCFICGHFKVTNSLFCYTKRNSYVIPLLFAKNKFWFFCKNDMSFKLYAKSLQKL